MTLLLSNYKSYNLEEKIIAWVQYKSKKRKGYQKTEEDRKGTGKMKTRLLFFRLRCGLAHALQHRKAHPKDPNLISPLLLQFKVKTILWTNVGVTTTFNCV